MPTKAPIIDALHRFRALITTFTELRSKETSRVSEAIGTVLPGFLAARKKWAEGQRHSADDFNLFKVVGIEGDEVRHSKLLAWLLDHRIERGTHAQGSLGFRLFLEELGRELRSDGQVPDYADQPNYWVHAEVSGDEARVDIEIAARGKFLIHVENKIYSSEGADQTDREWRDLQARRKELAVPEESCHAIFLTLGGSRAENQDFRHVAWHRIARILDAFAEQAEPPEVKLFARHYSKAVRKLSAVELEQLEDEDAEV